MRERAQASVETIALMAAALALAAALLLGVVRLGTAARRGARPGALRRLARAAIRRAGPRRVRARPAQRRDGPRRRRPDAARPAHAAALAPRSAAADAAFASDPPPARRARARGGRSTRRRARSPSSTARARTPGSATSSTRRGCTRRPELVVGLAGTPGARHRARTRGRPRSGRARRRDRARPCRGRRRRARSTGIRDVVLRRRRAARGLTVISDDASSATPRGRRADDAASTGQASVEYAGLLAVAAVLGAALALIAGPPLVGASRDALAAVLVRLSHGRRPQSHASAADIADVQSALLPGDERADPGRRAARARAAARGGPRRGGCRCAAARRRACRRAVARQARGRTAPGRTSAGGPFDPVPRDARRPRRRDADRRARGHVDRRRRAARAPSRPRWPITPVRRRSRSTPSR